MQAALPKPDTSALYGLRAPAMLAVLLSHYGKLGVGWMSLQLFFVLSGYLITMIILKEQDKTGGFKIKSFWTRRILRVFPPYYAFLFVLGIIYLLTQWPPSLPGELPTLATFVYNIKMMFYRTPPDADRAVAHFWSLSLTEQFYLFWPLALYALPRKWCVWIAASALLWAPISRYLIGEWLLAWGQDERNAAHGVYVSTLGQADALACGALLALLQLDVRLRKPGQWVLAAWMVVLLGGLVQYVILKPQGMDVRLGGLGYYKNGMSLGQHIWEYTLLNFGMATLVAWMTSPFVRADHPVRRLFRNHFLDHIGRISFGMYVYHFVILEAYIHIWAAVGVDLRAGGLVGIAVSLALFVVYFGIVWGFSALSYRYFETPFLHLKARLAPKAEATLSAIPVPALADEQPI